MLFNFILFFYISLISQNEIFKKISIIGIAASNDVNENDYFETYIEYPEDMDSIGQGRNAFKQDTLKWPRGIIPYEISNEFKESERDTIINALKFFNEKTCIQVIPKQDEHKEYVFYKPGEGCGTMVGYNKLKSRPHEVVFNDYCIKLPEAIQHETMHVMGIFHEQCQIPKILADSYDIEYDYNSLMHYGATAFRKSGKNETMRIKQRKGQPTNEIKLGQLGYATKGDILKMNRMYHCSNFI
ncbi:zinc metalloproteinase nas-13-like [Condylostylus longicornis]|uniref:zinc metalloproteinase nas-13-like n=1 Tax=Condylostylus longicornis TaxID=2530218 RepID=UPI00244D9BBC|nr:zinc metalloproteinase nas-13-like [Condylostylus longicornis]